MMSLKSRKRDQKNSKKLAQNFRFSCFLVWPLYNTEQAELQPETPRVQSFGAKSGASAAKQGARASVLPTQQFKYQNESPD